MNLEALFTLAEHLARDPEAARAIQKAQAEGRPIEKSDYDQNRRGQIVHVHNKVVPHQQQIEQWGKDVRRFVEGTLAGKRVGTMVRFNIISEKKAIELAQVLHGPMPVGAPEFVLMGNAFHVRKNHPDVALDDWERLPEVANDYEAVFLLRPQHGDKGQRVMFVMRYADKQAYAYVAELIPGGKKTQLRFHTTTFLKDHINTVVSRLEQNAHDQKAVSEFKGRI